MSRMLGKNEYTMCVASGGQQCRHCGDVPRHRKAKQGNYRKREKQDLELFIEEELEWYEEEMDCD